VSDQRQLGVDAFNETWRLMLSRENDELMLDCAHASRYHWTLAPECTPENRARSAWLLSRAYVVAGDAAPALHHAERCLELCEESELRDWDLAFAYEALARANLLAGEPDAAASYVKLARAVEIAEDEDREQLAGDLATLTIN
jgi:hypothetical protein